MVSMGIFLPKVIYDAMLHHVDALHPEEACGLLAGNSQRVTLHFAVENKLHSRQRFEMDPAGLVAALEEIDRSDMELLAIYHSHPAGPAGLSTTDIRQDFYPEVNKMILTRQSGEWELHSYKVINGAVEEEPITLIE